MAKLIAKFAYAELKSVISNNKSHPEGWDLREAYIKKAGTLSLFESVIKHPGERFAYMNCFEGGELTTGCGKIEITDTELKITTKNSSYVFKIHGKEYQIWVDEKMDQAQ